MASKCPKCSRVLADDTICCADITYTWKCSQCGKLSQGFVVPYGKCYLCGGDNQVVAEQSPESDEALALIREAVQLEVDMYHFYRLAVAKVGDDERRAVLEDLFEREKEHFDELESKYHLALDAAVLAPSREAEQAIERELFAGVRIESDDGVRAIYEKALELEQRTHRFFVERGEKLPEGAERELCRELAAEEAEHVSILESELQHL